MDKFRRLAIALYLMFEDAESGDFDSAAAEFEKLTGDEQVEWINRSLLTIQLADLFVVSSEEGQVIINLGEQIIEQCEPDTESEDSDEDGRDE